MVVGDEHQQPQPLSWLQSQDFHHLLLPEDGHLMGGTRSGLILAGWIIDFVGQSIGFGYLVGVGDVAEKWDVPWGHLRCPAIPVTSALTSPWRKLRRRRGRKKRCSLPRTDA